MRVLNNVSLSLLPLLRRHEGAMNCSFVVCILVVLQRRAADFITSTASSNRLTCWEGCSGSFPAGFLAGESGNVTGTTLVVDHTVWL